MLEEKQKINKKILAFTVYKLRNEKKMFFVTFGTVVVVLERGNFYLSLNDEPTLLYSTLLSLLSRCPLR